MNYITISNGDLVAVSFFVLLSGALSIRLSLGIERQLFIGAVRMVAQLAAVGAILTLVFSAASLGWTLAMALMMALFAGREVAARQQRPLAGWWGYGLGGAAITLAASILTLAALLGAVRPEPWHDPRYAIPLFGMILGNAMTGVSLGLDALTQAAVKERGAIEARLALGATRWEALRPQMREAMRRGFMPMINAMAAAGVVSLPGMMTGSDPVRRPAGRSGSLPAADHVPDRRRHRARPAGRRHGRRLAADG